MIGPTMYRFSVRSSGSVLLVLPAASDAEMET